MTQLPSIFSENDNFDIGVEVSSESWPNTHYQYDYSNPLNVNITADRDPLFGEIVATEAFQRLHEVRFLGSIDYFLVPFPNGAALNLRYDRFQHSIGVAKLALFYADALQLSENDRRVAYVSALLHDVGHAPFSHSLEPVFQEAFGVNHHDATEDIISGRIKLGVPLNVILRRYGVDPDEIISVLSGKDEKFRGFFSGPINFDTIEAILRTRQYYKPDTPELSPIRVVKAAIERGSEKDLKIVDHFWALKDEAYKVLIRSQRGVLADYVCQQVVRDSLGKITRNDYFSTERNLFKKLPELRKVVQLHLSGGLFHEDDRDTLYYKARSFSVNLAGSFFCWDDRKRYVQSKEDRVLYFSLGAMSEIDHTVGDLFDSVKI